MRYFVLLLATLPAFAQDSDPKILQALLSEVQQLRFAIERSTLLGARTQLAISQLQLQEGRMAKLTQELNDVRAHGAEIAVQQAMRAQQIKDIEQQKTLPLNSTAEKQMEFEGMFRAVKSEQEQLAARESVRSSREAELASQFQSAQRDVNDARSRIAELERSLDAAIQQILKAH